MASFGMVKEKPGDLLKRIGGKARLYLANDTSKILLARQDANLGVKRFDKFALNGTSPFSLADKRLARAVLLLLLLTSP